MTCLLSACMADPAARPREEEIVSPRLEALPRVVEFGVIGSLSRVTQEIELLNTGTDPLLIKGIEAGCRCTSVDSLEVLLAPEQSYAVPITFDPRGRSGVQEDKLKVIWDAPDGMPLTIDTKAEVHDTLVLSHAAVVFEIGENPIAPPKTIRIESLTQSPFELTDTKAPDSLVCEIGAYDPTLARCEVRIELLNQDTFELGDTKETVWIQTTDPGQPWIEIQVFVNVQKAIACEPAAVFLPSLEVGEEHSFTVRVKRLDGQPFQLTEVRADVDWLKIDFDKKENVVQEVTVVLAAMDRLDRNGAIRLKGTRERREMATLPIGYTLR